MVHKELPLRFITTERRGGHARHETCLVRLEPAFVIYEVSKWQNGMAITSTYPLLHVQ